MSSSGIRPRVLVVDDIEANLLALEALLEDLDCEVIRASSGNDALVELLKREFAVVLLDVQMPEMDGFEVARLARGSARAREVPIIFVTAMVETIEIEGYDSGAVDVLFKPINAHMLKSKVKVFLELYRGKRRLADEISAHKRTLAELDAFNYSVSHDLRAPLRPLAGFTQVLIEDYAPRLDEEGVRLLRRIQTAAKRMDQLICDLLRLSQINRARPASAPVDLSLIIAQVVAEIRLGDPESVVEVTWPDDMKTRGDGGLLRIALENLLRNAWKFTGKRPDPKIAMGIVQARGTTAFFVKDNGAGFGSASAPNLFKPFHRLHSADEFEGTGIGLAIVRRIVQHHGGEIWAEAAPNEGATFYFTLQA